MTRSNALLTEQARVMHGPTVRAQVAARGEMSAGLLIDGHVHVHECFDVGALLDHAVNNLASAERDLNISGSGGAVGCLLLAENPTDGFFEFARSRAEVQGWRIEPTKEPCSIICRRSTIRPIEESLILIAGRQIVVREGLEVLALCCDRRFQMGRSLKSTLEQAIRAGALPVLPWGFGKWWFRRGALVRKVIESGFSSGVWLGDNGNRLHIGPGPRLFRLAARRGMPVLPGSDPLPMRGRERDAGRCGFFLDGQADLDHPAEWIKRVLNERRSSGAAIRAFGRGAGVARFCVSQIAMQLRKKVQRP